MERLLARFQAEEEPSSRRPRADTAPPPAAATFDSCETTGEKNGKSGEIGVGTSAEYEDYEESEDEPGNRGPRADTADTAEETSAEYEVKPKTLAGTTMIFVAPIQL